MHMDTLLLPSEVTDSMHKSGEQLLQGVSASEKQNRAGESQGPTGQGREKAGISTLVHCPSSIPVKVRSRAGKLRPWQCPPVLDT